uniref:ATP-dependent DNA helicase n=1 Tax=Tanacetum cinerariifolium TaxID=118510 RepID=A0A699GT98_TANCI|nr:DNA helicase [Tanacetum cinerariifolium]
MLLRSLFVVVGCFNLYRVTKWKRKLLPKLNKAESSENPISIPSDLDNHDKYLHTSIPSDLDNHDESSHIRLTTEPCKVTAQVVRPKVSGRFQLLNSSCDSHVEGEQDSASGCLKHKLPVSCYAFSRYSQLCGRNVLVKCSLDVPPVRKSLNAAAEEVSSVNEEGCSSRQPKDFDHVGGIVSNVRKKRQRNITAIDLLQKTFGKQLQELQIDEMLLLCVTIKKDVVMVRVEGGRLSTTYVAREEKFTCKPNPDPPEYFKNLFENNHFIENIRAYNQMFAMTSFGAKVDDSINRGSARDKYMEIHVPEFKIRLYNAEWACGFELLTSNTLGAVVFNSEFPLLFVYGQAGFHTKLKLGAANVRFYSKEQEDIRGDHLSGLYDAISRGECDVYEVGRRIILLMSFIGGPRYIQDECSVYERYWPFICKTINDVFYPTCRATCEALGLLCDDKEWDIAMQEASVSATSSELRFVSAHILIHCDVTDPSKLWRKYWAEMGHDIPRRVLERDVIDMLANRLFMEEKNYNLVQQELMQERDESVLKLNTKQQKIYDLIIDANLKKQQELIFVYGHEGTCKTFLWKTIISTLHSEEKIVLVVASSVFTLSENMRLAKPNISVDERSLISSFASWLLDIGDRKTGEPDPQDPKNTSWVDIPINYCILDDENGLQNLINFIYDQILEMVQGKTKIYLSHDEATPVDNEGAETEMLYPIGHLNTLKPTWYPPHRLELRVGAPVMLLRNVNVIGGLCNRTRMIFKQIMTKLIEVQIISGTRVGEKVFIHIISLIHKDPNLPFVLKRRQFPLKLCYAMTINKSQAADNHPPMLEKELYDSWKNKMELYMMNRQHGRMILESAKNGPLVWPTIEENGVTRPRKYSVAANAIQADCDVQVGPTLQQLVEAILVNKGLLFVTTAKEKDTYPNSTPNLKGNGMIIGLRPKCNTPKLGRSGILGPGRVTS